MRTAMHHLNISAVRAEALFVSTLQRSEEPSTEQVRHAVIATVRALGSQGCAERVAQEFGDHPETAVSGCGGRSGRPARRSPHDPRQLAPGHWLSDTRSRGSCRLSQHHAPLSGLVPRLKRSAPPVGSPSKRRCRSDRQL